MSAACFSSSGICYELCSVRYVHPVPERRVEYIKDEGPAEEEAAPTPGGEKINYKILKTVNGRYPVYKRFMKSGREVNTMVRHVRGDINQCRRHLSEICEAPVRLHIGSLEVRGIHTWKIVEFLRSINIVRGTLATKLLLATWLAYHGSSISGINNNVLLLLRAVPLFLLQPGYRVRYAAVSVVFSMSRQFISRAVLPVSAVACGLIAITDPKNRPRPRVWCEEDPRDWINQEMRSRTMEDITMGQYGKWTRAWNADWDGRNPRVDAKKEEKEGTEGEGDAKAWQHGQYNLDSDENELTELGREQSRIVGQRLKQMTDGTKSDRYGERKIKFKKLISSDVLRAKQTAEIIHEARSEAIWKQLTIFLQVLGGEKAVHYETPDPILAEGWPCVPMPMSERSYSKIRPARLLEEGNRLEAAYRKYVHRARDHKKAQKKKSAEKQKASEDKKKVAEDYYKPGKEAVGEDGEEDEDLTKGHEYYIVVCHMNVIRYFVCRALQLPPEAWLRMGGENCGITELIIRDDGGVSLARFGDNGHLTIEQSTFH
ncbi:hypothetical protein FOL47_010962 [Perkinsus chesapeaki]|uniref:Serine/threonine-protein phosphatase PGAM5, mitochondrial n=1 Tax=Perkinsus chesapeaki TaxID=330153 RepID=A0A7J6N469_PERCH|nr:hypothetical protein FOL47_010962 [Perkinsus chesapeaki]